MGELILKYIARGIDIMTNLRTKRPENNRPKMTNIERAKQFAPFAALGKLDKTLKAIEDGVNIGELEHVEDLTDLSAEEIDELLNKEEN